MLLLLVETRANTLCTLVRLHTADSHLLLMYRVECDCCSSGMTALSVNNMHSPLKLSYFGIFQKAMPTQGP